MPLPVPSLRQLRRQTRQSFAGHLPDMDTTLRFSNLGVVADTQAQLSAGEYLYLQGMSEQLFPDAAEESYVVRWGRIFGVDRLGASPASGNVIFSGEPGTVIAANTTIIAGSIRFTTQVEVTLDIGGEATVAVVALDAGEAGNLEPDALLSLAIAVAGADPQVVVAAGGLTGGADIEADDDLRTRLLERIRTPPQGGAARDYVAWAKLHPGVTRVWVYPLMNGAGTVGVTFVLDGRDDTLPETDDVDAVTDIIADRRPVTADVTVFSPVAEPLDVSIANLEPDTSAIRAGIAAALADLISNIATPGAAIHGSGVSQAKPGGTIPLERIYTAISQVTGVEAFDIVTPVADVTAPARHIATPGAVSFI